MSQQLGTNVSAAGSTGQSASVNHTLLPGTLGNRIVEIALSHEHDTSLPPTPSATYGGVNATFIATTTSNNQKAVSVFQVLEADLPADGVNAAVGTLTGGTGAQGIAIMVRCIEGAQQQATPITYPAVYISTVNTRVPVSPANFSTVAGDSISVFLGSNGGTATLTGSVRTWTLSANVTGHGGDFNGAFGYCDYTDITTEFLTVTMSSEVLVAILAIYRPNASAPPGGLSPGLIQLLLGGY